MSATGSGEVVTAAMPVPLDCAQQIAALRASGAHLADPVRFHYLEVLSARAQVQQGRVRTILEEKLAREFADFGLRLTQANAQLRSGTQEAAVPGRETLGELVRSLVQPAQESVAVGVQVAPSNRQELKSVRLFRNTWSKLSADKQLNAALDQAPKNAGPINSHMLVLRSLALMRDLSPDYLNRFISYTDTLVYLEQSDKGKVAVAKPEAKGEGSSKPKVRRTRAR